MLLELFHIFELVVIVSIPLLCQNSTLKPLGPSSLTLLQSIVIPIIIVHLKFLNFEEDPSHCWMNERKYLAP